MRCIAFGTQHTFDIATLNSFFKTRYKTSRFREVLHIQLPEAQAPETEAHVFLFAYGAWVCWGLQAEQEKYLLEQLQECLEFPIEIVDTDTCTYHYGDKPQILEEEITLPNHEVLTKLALSHGLAQSVKLGVFEHTIQKTIHLTRQLPEDLAKEGKIKLSRKDIRRMMGRLFIDRNSINLHLELLDTPEFFWEHDELEPLYAMVAHYLDRERRVLVLNQKLAIVQELLDMLGTELNNQHSSYLEMTIIILILVEVVVTLARDMFNVI